MNMLKRLSPGKVLRRLMLPSLVLVLCFFMIASSQATVVIRFLNRSLLIANSEPGATTDYTVSFTYNDANNVTPLVGSIDMLFCIDPIPSEACVAPTGLDVSGATLDSQTGETGYAITTQTANHIVLSRTPTATGSTPSQYVLKGIVNPNYTVHSYAIRLSDYSSSDATGPLINLGSVVTQANEGLYIQSQVPPMLIFCLGKQVVADCTSTSGGNYTDMGSLDSQDTLTANSQMAVGTNASGGYAITVNGSTMQAGSHVINPLLVPTLSAPGNSQFGLNLVSNSQPNVGNDPDGASANANPAADYATPNEFKYTDGDVVASAPNVSLIRRFTVSYILNSPPNVRAGVYTTTLTYICSGRF